MPRKLIFARECERPTSIPKAKITSLKGPNRLGLTYENNVFKSLKKQFTPRGISIKHNAFFQYQFEGESVRWCSPDVLINFGNEIIVIEVKLTWVEGAMIKLVGLYCPVVSVAHGGRKCCPVVVTKTLTSEAPTASLSLTDAIQSTALLHWPICNRSIRI